MIRAFSISSAMLALIAQSPSCYARPPQKGSIAARIERANRAAVREPLAAGYMQAIQVYPYVEGTLYRLYAAPERVTDITLQPGETISSVAAGDTVRWTVGDTTSGNGDGRRTHILVKPFSAGLHTNLVIATDRRTYHLELESRPMAAMVALSWTYPQDALLALKRAEAAAAAAMPIASSIGIEHLNFNYRIIGDEPAWRPVRVFDDGRLTFIEFPASIGVGEAPPLFVSGEDGGAQLVNYRMTGRYYVVDRLFAAAELRLGEKRQQIVRIERTGSKAAKRGRGA